ncbi:MAG: hypothetical protein Q4G50_06450 [Corynebacterium sp.]|uniref:hypothetical protein n=1 Tax=Corynebacterium sp. TaxID=1720 RepID=UPI0026E064D9|nr:hypothetical protein [Corynebacterium sp.]MDO5669626.1 hypothetical protein [Corynebacterium sp.]
MLGVGTVEKLAEIGLTVNDVTQYRITLRVRGADMREFTGDLQLMIPLPELASFSEGTIMPVAYEPDKPQRLLTVPDERMAEAQEMFNRLQVQLGLASPHR